MGLSLWNIDPTLKFYEEDPQALIVPIGVTSTILQITGQTVTQDLRFEASTSLQVEFTGKLYDYQAKAVERLVEQTMAIGVLEAPTAAGKTVCICNLITRLKQPSLILVHTQELKNQFTDKLKQFTNLTEIGSIGDGEYIIKPVTVALLQSMHRLSDDQYKELNSIFGFVYLDESHIAPAETFF